MFLALESQAKEHREALTHLSGGILSCSRGRERGLRKKEESKLHTRAALTFEGLITHSHGLVNDLRWTGTIHLAPPHQIKVHSWRVAHTGLLSVLPLNKTHEHPTLLSSRWITWPWSCLLHTLARKLSAPSPTIPRTARQPSHRTVPT